MIEKEKLIGMVTAVQNGENDAATVLYETFYNDIYYYIKKTVNDERLAEDLTQETFIEILQTINKLKEPAAFVTWSKTIAYHKCTAYFRKRKDLLTDETEDGYSVFDTVVEEREEFIPDEALDKEDFKKTIHEMIDSLPEVQRSAIMMRYFDEISVKEIAEIQGVSEGTVKSRLNYGRMAIKDSVEAYEKKYGLKIHCKGVVPLLLWLFREYKIANAASAAATVATTATAATASATSSSATTASAAEKGFKAIVKIIMKKLTIGATTAAVAVGGYTVYQSGWLQMLEFEEKLKQFAEWDGYDGDEIMFQVAATICGEVPNGFSPAVDRENEGWYEDEWYRDHFGIRDREKIQDGYVTICDDGPQYYCALIQVKDKEDTEAIVKEMKENISPDDWLWYNEGVALWKGVSVDEFVFHANDDLILVSYVSPKLVEDGTWNSPEEMNEEMDLFVKLREYRMNE